jgi:hypothetical protein
MDWSFHALRALGGMALLAAAGCYSYSPYGYGGYPTYGGPVGTPVPGGTYIGPGTTVAPGTPGTFSQPYVAPGGGGTDWRSTPQQFPTPADPQSDAPPYNSGSASGIPSTPPSTSGGGTFVPNYGDPNDSFNTTPFESRRSSSPEVELEGIEEADSVAGTPFTGDDLTVFPTTERRALSETMAVKVQAAPNPYAYDREQYAWLRGKVDFDPVQRTWNIIYSLTPDETDSYQGSLTLADGPQLAKLQNDDVVVVEGRLLSDVLDVRGKPCYQVDSVFGPLKPRG